MTTKAAARLVAIVGTILVGAILWRARLHEVRLVYDVARVPGATSVAVTLSRDGAPYRRAELAVPAGPDRTVHHDVSLPDGTYRLDYRIASPAGEVDGGRDLEIHEQGTIVLPLGGSGG